MTADRLAPDWIDNRCGDCALNEVALLGVV